ncbi:MAG: four-carbon acid sugar kinase family protein [Betaproteobacteria bacterium]|nr:four-carbon acid sugar kinase family protein [Betaproteobacteria bacterium]
MNHELLLAYYGDDFTGSTDVMEALSKAGLRTVLFLKPPTISQLARYPGLRAFGIAGGSRTMSPEEMERALPPAFKALRSSGAPIIHYKMCSTFDSSPNIGSIGRAIEIGRRVFGDRPTPLMVGAPVIGRYVAFGNLFARSGLDTEPFRLDRHPTMSRHPVTPMQEADIRLILAEQTQLPVVLVDVLKLESASGQWSVVSGQSRPPIVLFDTLREAHLPVIGREIGRLAAEGQLFVLGSSGVEYALVEHWRETGAINTAEEEGRGESRFSPPRSPSSAVQQLICVSGSCSPVTDRQIARAIDHGFAEIGAGPELLASMAPIAGVLQRARTLLEQQRSVVIHSSRGPDDARYDFKLGGEKQSLLCDSLGRILETLLGSSGLRRAVVCGGDTSMHVARGLGVEALEYVGPIAPGSPLCKIHAPGRIADGCEIVFKGGQVGRDHFFLDVLQGGPRPT